MVKKKTNWYFAKIKVIRFFIRLNCIVAQVLSVTDNVRFIFAFYFLIGIDQFRF